MSDGPCLRCGRPRGRDGTEWYCPSCVSALADKSRCSADGCHTVLSKYNKSDRCAQHYGKPDAVELEYLLQEFESSGTSSHPSPTSSLVEDGKAAIEQAGDNAESVMAISRKASAIRAAAKVMKLVSTATEAQWVVLRAERAIANIYTPPLTGSHKAQGWEKARGLAEPPISSALLTHYRVAARAYTDSQFDEAQQRSIADPSRYPAPTRTSLMALVRGRERGRLGVRSVPQEPLQQGKYRVWWAAAFRQLRHDAGLSTEEMAAATGVTQRMISRWENEETFPRLPGFARLVAVFGGDVMFPLLQHYADMIHDDGCVPGVRDSNHE